MDRTLYSWRDVDHFIHFIDPHHCDFFRKNGLLYISFHFYDPLHSTNLSFLKISQWLWILAEKQKCTVKIIHSPLAQQLLAFLKMRNSCLQVTQIDLIEAGFLRRITPIAVWLNLEQ